MKTLKKSTFQTAINSIVDGRGLLYYTINSKNIIRISFILLLLTIITTYSSAQSRKFDGYWFGTIATSGDNEVEFILKIENNVAHQMTYSEDDGLQMYELAKESTQYLRNNICYTWLNMGGAWTETQTFMLSYLNPEELQLLWIRQVNNFRDYEDNEEWFVTGRGIMRKLSDDEVAVLSY